MLKIPRLSLLPSSLGLIDIQENYIFDLKIRNSSVNEHNILRSVLKSVISEYDYVLIDCPPNLGFITKNGINISTGYVIPTIPDVLSTYGIPQILASIENFADENGFDIQPKGIIISKKRGIDLHDSKLRQLKTEAAEGKKPPIFETIIPEAADIAASPDSTSPVNTLRQKYGYKNYPVYSKLTEEFIQRCQ